MARPKGTYNINVTHFADYLAEINNTNTANKIRHILGYFFNHCPNGIITANAIELYCQNLTDKPLSNQSIRTYQNEILKYLLWKGDADLIKSLFHFAHKLECNPIQSKFWTLNFDLTMRLDTIIANGFD